MAAGIGSRARKRSDRRGRSLMPNQNQRTDKQRKIWDVEISFYESDVVSPEEFRDALETWIFDKYPDFSGVIGVRCEVEIER
jgi:hypothetical protein